MIFGLQREEVSEVISCYSDVLADRDSSSAEQVFNALYRLKKIEAHAITAGRLPDAHLTPILLMIARHSAVDEVRKKRGISNTIKLIHRAGSFGLEGVDELMLMIN
ncbi:hypothetical protein AO260_26015 [Pseudomonas sp. ABAC21]|nr:hypothetical protein AO260_26015 [Pseudomonas sp. ABAC21]